MNYTGFLTLTSPAPPPPVLKIEPGDVIIISTHANLKKQDMLDCLEGAKRYFPGHKVAILTNGMTITTARPAATASADLESADPQELGLISPGEYPQA